MALRNDIVHFALETQQNPYLLGMYTPVDLEITAEDLEIIGELPADLNGVYVRNGPNPRYVMSGRYHWFDGDGMMHAVHIHDGKVTYRNRWIRTSAFEREQAAGQSVWTGLLEPLGNNPPEAPIKDTGNTDVVFHNTQLLALWYLAGKPYKLDPITLETKGVEDFGGKLRNNVSAHAKVDERTGEMMFFDYAQRPPYMTYGVASADGKLAHCVPIDLPGPRLPHDMAVTEHYSILLDLPLFADPAALRQGRYRIEFHRELPSRFGIIPRYGASASIRWFEANPCYLYHTINAWEEGDEIILQGCRVKRPSPPEGETGGTLERMLAYLRLDAHLYRWRFNLKTGAVREGPLDDENTEFPTINTWQLGRPSRYAYNVHISERPTLLFDGLVKYDTVTGQSTTHWFGAGRYGSEAPFAPRADAKDEDDGYLLTFVYDERDDVSELLILDARDVAAAPLARVRIPQRVPIGFHACWVPESRLAAQ
ncbi:MAG TPA: carotenoid oxygenase family protein [Ktedonobacterales bacterium]|jgi:carotenoid cleavage dioxygenase